MSYDADACGSGAATTSGGALEDYVVDGRRGRGGARRHPPAAGDPGARPGRAVELQGGQVRLLLGGDQRQAAADVHDPDVDTSRGARRVTVTPMRTFPVIRDLVTDVSFNYEKAREIPSFTPGADDRAGRLPDEAGRRGALAGVPQVHRVLPVPERLPRHPRPRGEQDAVRRSPFPHPLRRAGDAPATTARPAQRARQEEFGPRATATSPSAAPRSARSTSRSPTTRSSR